MTAVLAKLCFGQRAFMLPLALIVLFAIAAPIQASILIPAPGVTQPPDIFTDCVGCSVLISATFPTTFDSTGNWEASGTYAVIMDPNAIAGVRAGAGLDFLYQFTNVPFTPGPGGSDDAIGRLTAIDFAIGAPPSPGYWMTDAGYNTGYCPAPFSCAGTGTPGGVDRFTADTVGFNFTSGPGLVPMTPGTTSVVLEIATDATNWAAGHQAMLDGGTLDQPAFQPAAAVPEPATTLLIGIGMLGLASLRRFRR